MFEGFLIKSIDSKEWLLALFIQRLPPRISVPIVLWSVRTICNMPRRKNKYKQTLLIVNKHKDQFSNGNGTH